MNQMSNRKESKLWQVSCARENCKSGGGFKPSTQLFKEYGSTNWDTDP